MKMWKMMIARATFWKLNLNQQHIRYFSTGPSFVHKRGVDLIHDPWFNKDTGFPATERDRLGLRGLLPPRVRSFEDQYNRFMESYQSVVKNTLYQPDEVSSLAQWRVLNRLHDRNETLYYKVLIENIEKFAPIVYNPTVGLVCQNYGGLFKRPRGMYFSAEDKGEMMSMTYNWPSEQVELIVVTDGSRILGLGDLGVQGIGMPIGKLDIYVAAAGVNPHKILPVMLDVGTNNKKFLEDPLYLGVRSPRLEGEEFLSIVDEFMEAVTTRWPRAIVQFEDIQVKWAFKTLQRYRKKYCMFNDDIQGTAGVAYAGLLGALRAQGRPSSDFVKQKIVVVGAGSGGIGALNMAKQAFSKVVGENEMAENNPFWLLDENGLVTIDRKNINPFLLPFARGNGSLEVEGLRDGASLIEVVKKVKPHVLVGLSGVGGIFNEEVLKAMRESESSRPAIFALSNPTTKAECTAADAFKHAGENIVFASGSPFKNVDLGKGKVGRANQAYNMHMFPGIALGTLLAGARLISDGMLLAAAECLASTITDDEIQRGILYPSVSRIREITTKVAAAVIRVASIEGLAEGYRDVGAMEIMKMSEEARMEYVASNMWYPVYSPLVHEK